MGISKPEECRKASLLLAPNCKNRFYPRADFALLEGRFFRTTACCATLIRVLRASFTARSVGKAEATSGRTDGVFSFLIFNLNLPVISQ